MNVSPRTFQINQQVGNLLKSKGYYHLHFVIYENHHYRDPYCQHAASKVEQS